jgi:hypothetical protein
MPLTSSFQDNRTQLSTPSTVGFKLSKPGYNALNTAGSNYIFDSSWPSLPIAFETTISAPFPTRIAHGLSYAPFNMVWASGTDPSGTANVSWRFILPADKTYIYFNTYNFSQQQLAFWGSATKLKVRGFNLDLSRDIDYALAPGDTFNMPYDPNYGIKLVKQGKDIHSKDMRDFVLHSRCQSPLILAVKTQDTSSPSNPNTVQYTSKLSYPSWVYGFIKLGSSFAATVGVPANTYLYAPYYQQAYPSTSTDGTLSYITYASSGSPDNGATLVILRDPMFAATQTTVQY